MIFLGYSNDQTNKKCFKLSSDYEVLSWIIVKTWCTSSFLVHPREGNEQ